MSIAQQAVVQPALGVHIADEPAALSAFLRRECAAAILRRQTPPNIQSWLDALPPENLPKGRVVLRPNVVAETVNQLCNIANLPIGTERDWLEADINALADLFSDLVSAKHLRLRLDVITTNACRKFHVDAINSRLVCTYRGTGTQYGISHDKTDPQRVFTVQTGAPILLRGSLWPEHPASGLLHRSPPIEGSGESRLVLVLDPVFDPDDEV